MIINHRGTLSVRRRSTQSNKILTLVQQFPFRTAMELTKKAGRQRISRMSIHKRLTELRQQGVLRNRNPRVCMVTGRRAATWAPVVKGRV